MSYPRPCRLLIVDDDIDTVRVLESLFAAHGFSVETSSNGRDGFLKISSGNYDVIVLDLVMPDVDGFDVLRTLREMYLPLLSRIIVLTGASGNELRAPTYDGEIFARIQKPGRASELAETAWRCARANGVNPPLKLGQENPPEQSPLR